MFNNQSEDQQPKKYLALYSIWCQDTNKKEKDKANHYMNGEFFQYVVTKYKDTGEYTDELCELLDLLIRKNLTHKNFIRYEAGDKHEMYSNAMAKIWQYTIKGYNPKLSTAFVFFTTAIRNAFKEVLKDYYSEKNMARNLLRRRDINIFVHNYEVQDICDFDESVTDALKFMNDEEVVDVKEDINEFYLAVKEKWESSSIRLIEDENAPKFKRQYYTFNHFIPVHNFSEESLGLNLYNSVNKTDFIEYAKRENVILDENKDIKELKKLFLHVLIKRSKGIVVDYFDLRVINEANGIPPSYIQNRATMVRKLGHQYIGVFSDEWEFKAEDGKELGKNIILGRIQESFDMMLNKSPISNGRYIRYSYIPREDFVTAEQYPKVWYGLKDDRVKRHISIDQTPTTYLAWLNTEKNPTRVYDACLLRQ